MNRYGLLRLFAALSPHPAAKAAEEKAPEAPSPPPPEAPPVHTSGANLRRVVSRHRELSRRIEAESHTPPRK